MYIIALQIGAFFPYIIGSRRFYQGKKYFLWLLTLGIILDALIGLSPVLFKLDHMTAQEVVPWFSWLFRLHIGTATFGMLGFIFTVIYVLVSGRRKLYPKLSTFQYKVFLPFWIFGVSIALVNFCAKVLFGVRLYDYW